MSSPEPDEDLKLAIALSLQQSLQPSQTVSPRHRDAGDTAGNDSEDDADMRRAIKLSLQDTSETSQTTCRIDQGSAAILEIDKLEDDLVTPALPERPPQSKPSGLMGLDRKAMDEARLARLGKRKRDALPDQSSKRAMSETPLGSDTLHSLSKSSTIHHLQYPKGTIKRTIAVKYPRTNDISIDQVLQSSTLRTAVLSSFMWDAEWLHRKLDPTRIKQIWVMNAKGQDVQRRWEQEMKDSRVPNLKIHFPPMGGLIHSMHSKFMLLFGEHKLRIVVTSANMTPIDWGEVANDWQPGVMENSVFLIDLPRFKNDSVGHKESLSSFGQALVHFLEQQNMPKNVVDGIVKFDFSQTEHLGFVHSIGGVHTQNAENPTGLAGLAACLKGLHLDNVKEIKLDYAASSLGAINDALLRRIHLASQGQPFTVDAKADDDVRKDMCIYFPTQETVDASVGGPDCGGIISLTRQNYQADSFPRECLRNYDSTRKGMLSHNKLLFARGRTIDDKPFAWVYVGSANISESAWGSQKVLKSGRMGSLNVRNWECGVVVPVPDEDVAHVTMGIPSMDVFQSTIEVPFHHPGRTYDGKQPWFFRHG